MKNDNKYSEAWELLNNKRYLLALELARELLKTAPDNIDYQHLEMCILFEMDDFEPVIKYYDEKIEADPNDDVAYFKRGLAKYWTPNFEAAIEDFNKAIELNNYYWEAFLWKGFAKFYLESIDDAIDSLTVAIRYAKDKEDCAEAYRMRAHCYCKKEMNENAIKDFTTYLECNNIDPDVYDIYYNRGIAYERIGNVEQANKDLAKASAIREADE